MKLKTFNPDSCPVQRNYEAFIRINQKSGLITVNEQGCIKMKLGEGDKIIFHQSEANTEDWFLQNLGKKGTGFELRAKENISKGLVFNNTTLVRNITESVLFKEVSGRLKIGEIVSVKGTGDLWTLITAGLRNK